MKTGPSALDGYKAAAILIESRLKSADDMRPYSLRRVLIGSASYRQGFYDAMLVARCFMVLGEYPEQNAEQIAEVLKGNRIK